MNNEQLAREILKSVGGEDNIQTFTHCATRLRMTLKDNEKADKDTINDLDGVISVVTKNQQFQIVIGNHVNKVYNAMVEQTNLETNNDANDLTAEPENNKSTVAKALDIISGIFVPIIPVLAGSGMIKALLVILSFIGWMSPETQTYQLLNLISDAGFYFLPLILAHSASVKFKTNPYISMTLGGVLLHPAFQSMVQMASESGGNIEFIGLPVGLVNYSSSVIPILLVIWMLSYIEPVIDRMVPSVIRIFAFPFLIFIIMAPIALIVLGPLGSYLGDLLALFLGWIDG